LLASTYIPIPASFCIAVGPAVAVALSAVDALAVAESLLLLYTALDVPSATGVSNVSGVSAIAGVSAFAGVPAVVGFDCSYLAYLWWPVIPAVVSFPFANCFPPFLVSMLLLASSDVSDVSCAAVGHAVAVFITAVISPMETHLTRVSAVAAFPTATDVSSAAGVSNVWHRCC
jgi:hypothetical protein